MQGENIQLTLVEAKELKTFGLRVFSTARQNQDSSGEKDGGLTTLHVALTLVGGDMHYATRVDQR